MSRKAQRFYVNRANIVCEDCPEQLQLTAPTPIECVDGYDVAGVIEELAPEGWHVEWNHFDDALHVLCSDCHGTRERGRAKSHDQS